MLQVLVLDTTVRHDACKDPLRLDNVLHRPQIVTNGIAFLSVCQGISIMLRP